MQRQSAAADADGSDDERLLPGARQFSDGGGAGNPAGGRASWAGGVGSVLDRLAPKTRGFSSLGGDGDGDGDGADASNDDGAARRQARWCPEEEAGWLSRLFFAFANGLVAKGARKHLDMADLWDTARRDAPPRLLAQLEAAMRAGAATITTHGGAAGTPPAKLWRALVRAHGRTLLWTGALKVAHDAVMFLQPYILERLLHHLAGDARDRGIAALLAAAMVAAALLEALTVNAYFYALFRVSLHVKTQLLEVLYRKALRISGAVRAAMGTGPIVNLQSNDAAKLWALPTYAHMVWNAPMQIIVVMLLLVRILGVGPAFAGLLVTIAIVPLSMLLGKLMAAARKDSVAAADARVKLCSEVVTGIKAIKLYAYEAPYSARIAALRERELRAIRRSQLLGMVNSSVFTTAPVLVSLAAFGTFTALGRPLTAAVAFPSLALFNLLRFPIVMLPSQIMNLVAASVAVARIQGFLDAEEVSGVRPLPPAPSTAAVNGGGGGSGGGGGGDAGEEAAAGAGRLKQQLQLQSPQAGTPALRLRGTFAWAPGGAPCLKGVDLSVPRGALVMVVGPVGGGKSSLLAALLGELLPAAGEGQGGVQGGDGPALVQRHADSRGVAFCAQDNWIQNLTLRGNVLMGRPYDARAYRAAVAACCLDRDLEQLPAGDATEIGDRGVNLSGGQKARVALARATYAALSGAADVVLLDDPLSAVDAHVGAHVFAECVCGALATATRVLVTHQLQFLPRADLVVVMQGGRMVAQGGYRELLAAGVDLASLTPPPPGGGAADGAATAAAAAAGAGGGDVASAAAPQPRANNNEPGAPLTQERGSVQLMELPAQLTRSLLVTGGSFASHKPQRLGDAATAAAAAAAATAAARATVIEEAAEAEAEAAALLPPAADGPGGADSAAAGAAAVALAAAAVGPAADASPALATAAADDATSSGSELSGGAPRVAVELVVNGVGGGGGGGKPPAKQQQQQQQDAGDDAASVDGEADGGGGGGGDTTATTAKAAGAAGAAPSSSGRLVQAEQRARGQVKRAVYGAYLRSFGAALGGAVLLGALVERGLQVLQNLVLSDWSNSTTAAQAAAAQAAAQAAGGADGGGGGGGAPLPRHTTLYFLTLYFALGLGSVAIVLLRSALLVAGSIAASRKLHARLLAKVLRLPMSFFDSQPTGRLVNRFTKDTEAVDAVMSNSLSSALTCLASALLSIAVVVGVSPLTLVALVPLALVYWRVQKLYISTSRELKRLDSLAFSPIFAFYGESLSGLQTIRAFGRTPQFCAVNTAHIEQSNRAWWPIQLLNRWLSMRLELTGAVVVFVAALAVGVVAPRDAGLAGLALTSALNLTGTLAWMVRQTTELEVNMNSVERMVEYEGEQEEAPAVREPRPPAAWPHAGAITAVQLVVRYRPDLPPVLKGLSFSVRPREKVGICGRTGCGKSTLVLVLFRMVEPCGGALLIDGLDAATLGLRDLRSRLSLVPQDPVIFSGSVRSNLDPFGDAPNGDADIWETLRRAGCDGAVRALGGLDAPLQEAGGNLSGGQRQLLCMARALLRRSRILVLDEATSNVDHATDALIQTTIRSAFADCTTLTIAHRLHTISSSSDRVLVLDQGRLLEFDTPEELMRRPQGAFKGLMDAAAKQQQH